MSGVGATEGRGEGETTVIVMVFDKAKRLPSRGSFQEIWPVLVPGKALTGTLIVRVLLSKVSWPELLNTCVPRKLLNWKRPIKISKRRNILKIRMIA